MEINGDLKGINNHKMVAAREEVYIGALGKM